MLHFEWASVVTHTHTHTYTHSLIDSSFRYLFGVERHGNYLEWGASDSHLLSGPPASKSIFFFAPHRGFMTSHKTMGMLFDSAIAVNGRSSCFRSSDVCNHTFTQLIEVPAILSMEDTRPLHHCYLQTFIYNLDNYFLFS